MCVLPETECFEPVSDLLDRQCTHYAQLVEQRLGLFQVERVEALREPAVDRREKLASLIPLALVAPPSRGAKLIE